MRKIKRFLSVLLVFCLIAVPTLSNVGCVIVHAEVNWLNGDAQAAWSALDAFLSLETSTTREELKGSLTALQGYIQEDRQAESGFSNALSYLEDESKSEEFAGYLLEWIATWRVDPGYSGELTEVDPTSQEGVDSALDCVMQRINGLCYRYDLLIGHMTGILDFVGYCKAALPKLSDEWDLDWKHEVTDDELYVLNKYVSGILAIYGGADFANDWNLREGNEGCTYPVNNDGTDIEFTKENVQIMIREIVQRAYYTIDDEERVEGLWYNWNYMHDLMNQESVTVKQNDDLAQLIVEAVGWGASMYAKPIRVSKTIPDEVEVPDGQERYTEERYSDLASALQSIHDENADYRVEISRSDAITLENNDFSGEYRTLEISLCDAAAGQAIYYDGSVLSMNGNVEVFAGSFQFNESVKIEVIPDKKVWFSINVDSGRGDVSYPKEQVDLRVPYENWEGIIENGDQQKIENAIENLDAMITPGMESGMSSSDTIVGYAEQILTAIVGTDYYNWRFQPEEIVDSPLWNIEGTEEEQKIEIKPSKEWPEAVKVALEESYYQWFEKDGEGNLTGEYYGKLDFYIRKLANNKEEITSQDQKDALHCFMDWIGDEVYQYNHYGAYKEKLKHFFASDSKEVFVDNLTDLITTMASDSRKGNDRDFYGAFDGEITDMWEVTQQEEPEWSQNITLHMENIPFEGIYDIYQEYKDTEENAWRFQDYSGDDTSVIKTYDTLWNLVWTVRDYGEMAKDAGNLKSAVESYRDVFARVYKDTCDAYGGIDKEKVHFESADLEILNNALSSFSDSKIAENHIRFWREENGQEVSFPENFTNENVFYLTQYLGEVLYCENEWTAQDSAILGASKDSLGWVYRAAEIMIHSIVDANYRYSTYHGMNYAQGEIDEIQAAVDGFYRLSGTASQETVNNAFSNLLAHVQEDRRNDYRMQDIKGMLENDTEFATYLAQMAEGWSLEEDFNDRVSKEHTFESADRNLQELAGSLEWALSQYESVGQEKTAIKDFIECCKTILPQRTEDGWIDCSKTVNQDTLNTLNQNFAKVLNIFGGDEFIKDWNSRGDLEYPVSGVNETLSTGLTKDNVKSFLWDIAARMYTADDEQGKLSYVWYNWNYNHEILNKNSWTMKEYRDVAQLIVEAIGWRVEAVEHPYELWMEGSEGQEPKRFETLELALNNVKDSNADYCIRISNPETVNLDYATLTDCCYHSLIFELCDVAENEKYYYSGSDSFPVNGELIFRGKNFEFDSSKVVKISTGNPGNAVLGLEVEAGSGNLSYDKLEVKVNVDYERWNGDIDNGDGERISEAAKKMSTLLNASTSQSQEPAPLVKEILSNLAETDEFSYDFSPNGAVTSSLSEKVWSYSETDEGTFITIKDEGFSNSEMIQVITEALQDILTKDENGVYCGELSDYVTKVNSGATLTKEEEQGALHDFVWWFGRLLLKSNNYKTWQSRLADIKNSSSEEEFIANIKTNFGDLAAESPNGRDRLFFWDFKNSAEDSGLWTANSLEETETTPYLEKVTFEWDSLISDLVYAQFHSDMTDPDCTCEYVVYDTENGSITGVYKAMTSLIWSVAEYQKKARDGEFVIPSEEPAASEKPAVEPSEEVPAASEEPEVEPSEEAPAASPTAVPSTEAPKASPTIAPSTEAPVVPVPGGGESGGENPQPTDVPASTAPEEPITTVENKGNTTITTTVSVEEDATSGEVTKTEVVIETNNKTQTSKQSTTVTTTSKNGDTNISVETKIVNSKGTVTKTITINTSIDVKTGMEIEVKEEKNSKGKVTSAEATVTPGVEALVHGKTVDLAFQFEMDKVLEMTNGMSKGTKVELSFNISAEKILSEVKKITAGNVNAFIEIPDEIKNTKNVKGCTFNLEKEILKDAKKSGNNLKVAIGDESAKQKTLYEWTFTKNALKNAKNLKDLDLSVSIQKPEASKSTETGKILNSLKNSNSKEYKQIMKNSMVCSLGNNGELGCEAVVKMYVGDYAKQNASYYLYYANPKTNKLEEVPCKAMKVKNGYLSAKLIHCSDYIFSDKKLSSDVATPLAAQITGIATSKKIEKGKAFTMKPVLPSTLSKVKKITRKDGADMQVVITYQSSDKSIATVGKTGGKVTGKKKGTCIITTNILLADGRKRTVRTKVSVK